MLSEIQIKKVEPLLVLAVENKGSYEDFDRDLERVNLYLWENNLRDKVAGASLGVFFDEKEDSRYLAGVPLRENILLETEEMHVVTLPEIECAFLVYQGCFKELNQVLEEIKLYFLKGHFAWELPFRQVFLRQNEQEADCLTEVQVPIKSYE